MSKAKDFSNLINSIKWQLATKQDILDNLEHYANNNISIISTKDFNNIFLMYSFKDKYFKNEVIKRISQKTILNAMSLSNL